MKNKINQLKKQLKNERGLTLVELLAVIVILAIISIIAFVFIGGIIENSKKDAHISNAQQVISAAKLHEATAGDLGEDDKITGDKLQEGNYLDQILDPWTKNQYDNLGNIEVKKSKEEDRTVYRITFPADDNKCGIVDASEKDLADMDREDLCEGKNSKD